MAGNCSQTLAGIAQDCSTSMGGVKRVLIANYVDITSVTAEAGVVSAIEGGTGKFHEYIPSRVTSSMETEHSADPSTGVSFYTTTLTLQFNRMNSAKKVELDALGKGKLMVIVQDNNNDYWLLGKDEPVESTGGSSGTGTARTDANRYGIVLTDNSLELPNFVQPSIIAGLLPA